MLDKFLNRYGNWAVLPLRITIGILFIAHGQGKLFGGLEGTAGFLETLGFQPPMFWAVILAISEFFGGILVVLGLFTRWASIPLAFIMILAILMVHLEGGYLGKGGYQYQLVLLGGALSMMLSGGGALSVDRLFKRKNSL